MISATTKAGDMLWRNEGLSVGTTMVLAASFARGERTLSVMATTGTPRACAKLARSEEHTSELQSLMRISYAVFCLKKKTNIKQSNHKSYTRIIHKHIYITT